MRKIAILGVIFLGLAASAQAHRNRGSVILMRHTMTVTFRHPVVWTYRAPLPWSEPSTVCFLANGWIMVTADRTDHGNVLTYYGEGTVARVIQTPGTRRARIEVVTLDPRRERVTFRYTRGTSYDFCGWVRTEGHESG